MDIAVYFSGHWCDTNACIKLTFLTQVAVKENNIVLS